MPWRTPTPLRVHQWKFHLSQTHPHLSCDWSHRGDGHKAPYMFLLDVISNSIDAIFLNNICYEQLPISIDTQQSHINLQLGPNFNTSNCLVIQSVMDTAVILTMGNLFFITKITKAVPNVCIKCTALTTMPQSSCLVSLRLTLIEQTQLWSYQWHTYLNSHTTLNTDPQPP
jgi:hypothetical protein